MKNLLHRLQNVFLIGALLLTIQAKAQYITIPDANFAAYLQQDFAACMNGNQLDTTCAGMLTAPDINCPRMNIASLEGVQYFKDAKTISCQSNQLTQLPPLPPVLEILVVDDNILSVWPVLPASLTALYCRDMNLVNLPSLPDSLKELACSGNMLMGISQLPASLTWLDCSSNELFSLTLPATLEHLNCSYNQNLGSLPALPGSLKELISKNCGLSTLPNLPDQLIRLELEFNQLQALPAPLPTALQVLRCDFNQLTSLPALPPDLRELHAAQNQLTSLPDFPASIRVIKVYRNDITSIPPVPPMLYGFDVSFNYNLYCIPPMNEINPTFSFFEERFSVDSTQVTCIPNRIQVFNHNIGSYVDVNMPVCDIYNANGCDVIWNIEGSVFKDDNNNCSQDIGEFNVPTPVRVNLYQAGSLVQSGYFTNGQYSFDAGSGTYTISIDTNGLATMPCRLDTTITLTTTDSIKTGIDFGLKCTQGFDVGTKSVTAGLLRPATDVTITTVAGDVSALFGFNCAANQGGTVNIHFKGPIGYVSAAPGALTPTRVSGDTITWEVPDFGLADIYKAFNIIVRTDTFATIGQQVCFTVTVITPNADDNQDNNRYIQCFEVRTSYDPNDKQASPSGNTDTANKWITYTVRFQNTGNDTAINIYIMDTLDNNLQVSTFELLSYSHQPLVQWFDPGIVKFNFPHIMLPDSNVNEPLSNGYVQYRVKRKDNLPIGTEIKNTAFIYFDFNAPVVTNTTVNKLTVDIPTGMAISAGHDSKIALNVFPNPATNQLNITPLSFTPQWLLIYDVNGKKIREQKFAPQVDITGLSSGMYLIEARSASQVARNRFVK